MKTELSKIIYEIKDDIGYVIINDPPANKMTTKFLSELNVLVKEYIEPSNVKGIIITGKGRHYSSGVEVDRLKELVLSQITLDNNHNVIDYPEGHQQDRESFNYFYNLSIPVISAINGFCVGAGLELALGSHIRICGTGSTLGLPESTFGFIPALCGTLRYLEICGLSKALELVLSGETYRADEAFELGVVDHVIHKKQTLDYSEGLMRFILEDENPYCKSRIAEYIKKFNEIY